MDDPTQEVCPNFATTAFNSVRLAMIGDEIQNNEQAIQYLNDAWQVELLRESLDLR